MVRTITITTFGVVCILAVVAILAESFQIGSESCYSTFTIFKENIPLEVKIEGVTKNQFFHFKSYRSLIQELVETEIAEVSYEEAVNNPHKITEKVKGRFNEAKATLRFLSIRVIPPVEFIEAVKKQKVTSLTLQTDSLISTSVKRDAVGYTPEAERLEERRDRRLNAEEERRIKMREIEANEKVKIRQAEAIENAADNLGMFSGDLTIEIH